MHPQAGTVPGIPAQDCFEPESVPVSVPVLSDNIVPLVDSHLVPAEECQDCNEALLIGGLSLIAAL